jgi:N-methylhydantoinase B
VTARGAALEVAWSRVVAAADEQAAALKRTSFTPVVRDSGDLSAAIFDARGWMIAQAVTGTPGHINSLAASMRHFLSAIPESTPGDVLITNEPWLSSGQLNDFTVVTPIHRDGRVIGYVGSTCHAVDIGGRGLSADASEVFEEGLRIPPMRLYAAGSPNDDLMRIIEANVRTPKLVLGDLHAQVVGNQVGASRVLELVADLELGDLRWLADEVSDRSERRLREAIASLPDRVYRSEVLSDGLEEPVLIRCAVEVAGDRLRIDYTGSSAQSERGINVVLNYTEAYTTYAVKCALAPDVPHNEGTFRPLEVRAPEGSILNARFPAAVAARHVVGQFLPFAVLEALAPVAPNAAMAQGSGNIWLTTARGGAGGAEPFVTVFFASGGVGARPERDGLSTTSFPSGIATTPVEVVESTSPLVIEEKRLRPDSGGPGRRRGGLGQRIRISVRRSEEWTVSCLGDRIRHPAPGMAGGGAGAPGGFQISARSRPDPKLSHTVPAGEQVVLDLPGGGGYGSPAERERELVERDLGDGRITGWPATTEGRGA